MGPNISTVMVVVTFVAALWWAFFRGRRQALLELVSMAALALAVATLVVEGLRWQLVLWQALALAVVAAAVLRRRRPGHSRRWRRVAARGRAGCRACARRTRAADGVRAAAAQAVRAAPKLAAWCSAGRTTRVPRRSRLTRQTAVRSSLRRGTRRMRRRAGRFRILRRKAICPRRSAGCRPSCSALSVASRPTRPPARRSVPCSRPGQCCSFRLGCRSRARSTRLSAPTWPAAATWSSRSACPYESAVSVLAGGGSSVRRLIRM